MSVHFRPRLSDQARFYIPCGGSDCDCPPSLIGWFAMPCPGCIAGRVTHSQTDDSLENVRIWVQSDAAQCAGEAISDGNGRFVISNLEPADDYILVAEGIGWSRTIFENGDLTEDGLMVNVQLERSSILEVRILDQNNNPVQGAEILLSEREAPGWASGEGKSNDQGISCFCNARAQIAYRVVVLHPDFSTIELDLPAMPPSANGQYNSLEVHLQSRATIEGMVVAGGLPVPGTSVSISRTDGGLYEVSPFLTSDTGTFSVSVTAPATYILSAMESPMLYQSQEISVSPSDVVSLPTFVFSGFGTIAGNCTNIDGEPLVGVVLKVVDVDSHGVGIYTVTGEGGAFSLSGISVGMLLSLEFTLADAEFSAVDIELPTIEEPDSTTTFNLTLQDSPPECQITSPSNGETVGTNPIISVQATDGLAVVGMMVSVNGQVAGTFLAPQPFQSTLDHDFNVDLNQYSGQNVTVKALAYNSSGLSAESIQISVYVS